MAAWLLEVFGIPFLLAGLTGTLILLINAGAAAGRRRGSLPEFFWSGSGSSRFWNFWILGGAGGRRR
jgi:hypothetical protein